MLEKINTLILENIKKSYNIRNISNKRTFRVISLNKNYYSFYYKKYNRKDREENNKINFIYNIKEINRDEFFKLCPYAERLISNKVLKKRYSVFRKLLKDIGENCEISKEEFILKYKENNNG